MRDSQNLAARLSVASPESQTNSAVCILVVEDDVIIRRFNTEALQCAGYEVDAAEDGAMAWGALQLCGYDLLITDNIMPKVSGVELLKKLRAAHMALPVIMATGTPPKKDFARYPWLQPDATLLKPYTTVELLGLVQKVLRATDDFRAEILPSPNQPCQPSADVLRL